MIADDPGGPSTMHTGVVIASNLDADDSHLFFDVRSPDGEALPDFELFGGVIEPEEFLDEAEPNNFVGEAMPVAFGSGRRVGVRGSVLIGDIDLISVQIDHNHRVGVIVSNDPAMTGQPIHSRIEILGSDGETVIATGSNLAGESGNGAVSRPLPAGTYFVRLANDNAESAGEYELLVMEIDDQRAVTDGLSPVDFERRVDEVNTNAEDEAEPNDQTTEPISVPVPANGAIRRRGQVLFGDIVSQRIEVNQGLLNVAKMHKVMGLEICQ